MSVRKVKSCNLGLENAGLGLRPRLQFFTIRTFQPANNIFVSTSYPWVSEDIFNVYIFVETLSPGWMAIDELGYRPHRL